MIVISKHEDHQALINTALRDAGHAAHCLRIAVPADLAAACASHHPELIMVVTDGQSDDIANAAKALPASTAPVPIIAAMTSGLDEGTVNRAMQHGARDAVSISHIEHLQAVAVRELGAYRIATTLQNVMNSASQYRHELDTLKLLSVEAIADIQEGIVVSANPSWLELFGYPEDTDLIGTPIMDLCTPTDQPALKGGLVACQRGKWQDDSLAVSGLKADGASFPVSFHLKNAVYDGDPAVRLRIKPQSVAASTPTAVIENALQCDPVTGLHNQQFFLQQAGRKISEPAGRGIRAVVFFRPDRFSRATADIGICATDDIILQLAQLLRDSMQQGDILSRFGGTLFAVMIERGTMADVEAWTSGILKLVAAAVFESNGRTTVLTCSAGLCELDETEPKLEAALAEAERACRRAREQGGNKFEMSEASGAAKSNRQQDTIWVSRIRSALMENRLRLEHQLIAGLNEEIDNAYDVLVRMLDEEGHSILPSEFMPAAERTGLTKNIDRWVIGAALSFCVTSNAELVFIRISRDSLLDESLPDWLQAQLARVRLVPARICLEIDEAVVIQNLTQSMQLIKALHRLGARFAIEHFGNSVESAQLLGRIPANFVKIDGSLMQGLHKNPELQERVRVIAQQARDARAFTVAERVQDANTMAVLWQLGVSYIQGNYIQSREIVIEDTSTSTMTTRGLQLSP